MITGIGLDIIEISRVRHLSENQPKFVRRILTEREFELYLTYSKERKVEFLAGRFAAKEAFSKALGTGIGRGVGFHDIEIDYDDKGKPIIIAPKSKGVHLSITHCQEYAAAQVIIESE
ncbi:MULTISPECIES: holo-ACP synthase [Bacillus]|uniref:holo-ACP synthase n=1 Tax=Bacillus TaxID=1386 RepID=UPI0002E782B9|nr:MULTISPECIES: holo-ACP synthase [Bacillus]